MGTIVDGGSPRPVDLSLEHESLRACVGLRYMGV